MLRFSRIGLPAFFVVCTVVAAGLLPSAQAPEAAPSRPAPVSAAALTLPATPGDAPTCPVPLRHCAAGFMVAAPANRVGLDEPGPLWDVAAMAGVPLGHRGSAGRHRPLAQGERPVLQPAPHHRHRHRRRRGKGHHPHAV